LFDTKETHEDDVESGKRKRGDRTGRRYSKCVGTGRAPNDEEVKAVGDRRHNEKGLLLRKIKKGGGSLGKAEAQQTNPRTKIKKF
jgi:hypothetical protein